MHKIFHAIAVVGLVGLVTTVAFAANGKGKKAADNAKAGAKAGANGGGNGGANAGANAGANGGANAGTNGGAQANGKAGDKREARAEAREKRQQERIHEGIKHGQLTPDEVKKLQSQEDSLKTMHAKFNSDGKLTKDESKQLEGALNDASLQIWAQRHDTEGNQKTVSRLGNDVFAKDEITKQIESGEMTHAQAQQFLGEFREMTGMKRRLASENLSDGDRQKLQEQYDDMLNKYFLIKGN
ncbi:MAG TPA: hypothetical protein VHS31_17160 [Tepidisphaeraceae bacterium]|jgi:hypothetical protein|nr:hypothetical protein [Tepidisphaeraceae bacterium]